MIGHTSHNRSTGTRGRRHGLLSLVAALAFLALLALGVAVLPETALGRTLDAHLDRLADPRSWIP